MLASFRKLNLLLEMYIFVILHAGLKLATVFDVMQLNPLPKVICSLQTWKGDDDKSSVVENELLVLKQVCGKRMYRHHRGVARIFTRGILN